MGIGEKGYNVQQRIFKDQLVTVGDLQTFKTELLSDLKKLLKEFVTRPEKKWMKTHEVRKFLGISPGTLQTIRVNGSLPYTKIGGVYYYDLDDVHAMLTERKFIKPTYP